MSRCFTLVVVCVLMVPALAALAQPTEVASPPAAPEVTPIPAAPAAPQAGIAWFPGNLDKGAFGARFLVSPYLAVSRESGDFEGGGPAEGVAFFVEGMGVVFGGGVEVALLTLDKGYVGGLTASSMALSVWPYMRFRIPTGTAFEPRFGLRFGYQMVKLADYWDDEVLTKAFHGVGLAAEFGALIKVTERVGITIDGQYLFAWGEGETIRDRWWSEEDQAKYGDTIEGMLQALVLAFGLEYRF